MQTKAALFALLTPVPPVRWPLAEALGRVSAESVLAPRAFPAARTARRDGYAVASHETVGASPYAANVAAGSPVVVWAGGPLPVGCDAVLPPHALRPAEAEILQAVAPGVGVRDSGDELGVGALVVAAGEPLRATQLAVLALAGIETPALRVATVSIAGQGSMRPMLEAQAVAAGASLIATDADVAILLSPPGHAGTRAAARTIATDGTLVAHGLALRPGEAIACGTRPRPGGGATAVFVVPDTLDDALAAWLLLIAPCIAHLVGSTAAAPSLPLPLSRKIVSAPGLVDLVLLRRAITPAGDGWEPLATGDLPWSAIGRAEAYAVVAAESEGFAAGDRVTGFAL